MHRKMIAHVVGALLIAAWTLGPVRAEGIRRKRPIAAKHWTSEAKLTLARAWVGEADWADQDHVAIGWVLAKRWKLYNRSHEDDQIGFAEFIRMYSAPLKLRKKRRHKAIQALPWGDPVERETGDYRFKRNVRRWHKVRERVVRWGYGHLPDPCPEAMHWGGTMDRPSGNWEPVNCGQTKNIFYRIRGYKQPRS